MRKNRGFTLLEVMITVAILGILMALAISGWSSAGERGATAGAAADFHSNLLLARQRAAERGGDVWVVIFPYFNKDGSEDPVNNAGTYILVEDIELNFRDTYIAAGTPSAITASGNNRILERVWLEEYARSNSRFLETTVSTPYKPPFDALNGHGCQFCVGTPAKGAIVFSGEGNARFLQSDGTPFVARSVSLGISSFRKPLEIFYFAVTGPTGFVGAYH